MIFLAPGGGPSAASDTVLGQLTFIAVFALLILVLLRLPRSMVGEGDPALPWWRKARIWAILIAVTQIALYAWWG